MWVLTKAYNDYDQYGDYLVSAYNERPTAEQIAKAAECDLEYANHILGGGGRLNSEGSWFFLTEIRNGEIYKHSN